MSSVNSSRPSSPSASSVAGFGTNEWLVEEMYQQYVADPASVDQAWHEFFADYRPGSPLVGGAAESASANGQPAAPGQGRRTGPSAEGARRTRTGTEGPPL